MVLSKDSVDVLEDPEVVELTTAQKRRLRRKVLKAAIQGTLDTDSNIQTNSHGLDIHPRRSIDNNPGLVSNKKQKRNKCDTQVLRKTENSNETPSNIDQKSKCENSILSNNRKHLSQKINKNKKSVTKITKTPDGSVISVVSVDDFLEIPGFDNDLKKNVKSTLNGNHQVTPEGSGQVQKKQNITESLCFLENRAVANLKLNKKQKVALHNLIAHKLKNPPSKDFGNIKTLMPSGKDHDKNQTIESSKSETISTKCELLKIENQQLKPQKAKSIQTIPPTLNKQDMGKIQDPRESQKKQGGSPKVESKQEDTTSDDGSATSRDQIKAAREAKKLAKQKAKKKDDTVRENLDVKKTDLPKGDVKVAQVKENTDRKKEILPNASEKTKTEPATVVKHKGNIPPADKGKTDDKVKKNLSEKPKEDVQSGITAEKSEEAGKSKAELRAERRAKQEAQRAAKQEVQRTTQQAKEQKTVAPEVKEKEPVKSKEEKPAKTKSADKSKSKTQSVQKVGWFQHLYVEKDKDCLSNIPINSNLHPAVVKLGVQLATRVVTGSNARCIALLDAIKKMVRDYSLPARTEFGRGLQAQLAAAAQYLEARRAPAAAETNALKHFRRQLTHLPANVDEFDAKKKLQEEIDRYIREQIDMAGEAIDLILRNKISPGDHILTYGCSSLIERVLCSAWALGVPFRTTVAGARGQRGPEMLRRLRARGLPAAYVDISALSYVMNDVQKVLLGAGALLAHGAALGAAGSAQVALVARARNVPVLVACETHKFSERTHLDSLVTHEIGDPDELIDKSDPNSPLKDWRSNPNLTLLNVMYDVTPPSLITAVVTELGILPCTSAPVVLRFKQSEYGM